jgi:ABC-2 type transport system ATP-binding protein
MVRELSLGERMKMELIAALLHRPRVLFLDEPTIGLDVVSQKAVRGFLRDYNRRHRTTILLTSHYMADIQELCDRVIVIDKGRKIYDGALDRLESAGGRKKIVRFRPLAVPFPGLADLGGGKVVETDDGEIVLTVPSAEIVGLTGRILAAGPVADITISDVPLEDVIAELFGRTDAPAAAVSAPAG